MTKQYTPAEAAEVIGASKESVRRYSRDFGKWMSPGAAPAAGQVRLFDVHDLELMQWLKRQYDSRKNTPEIVAMLEAGEGQVDITPIDELGSMPSQKPVDAVVMATTTIADTQAKTAAALDRMTDLAPRVSMLEAAVAELRERLNHVDDELVKRRPWWRR